MPCRPRLTRYILTQGHKILHMNKASSLMGMVICICQEKVFKSDHYQHWKQSDTLNILFIYCFICLQCFFSYFLFLFPAFSVSIPSSFFLLGLVLFVPKVNKLISRLLPCLLLALVVFLSLSVSLSRSQCFCFPFSPTCSPLHFFLLSSRFLPSGKVKKRR